MYTQSPSPQPKDRLDEVMDTYAASKPFAASAPTIRQYTDADFAALARDSRTVLGLPEATAWGVVMLAYISVAGVRMLFANSDQIAGDNQAADRFSRFSARWIPGLVMLMVAWSLSWPLVPSVFLTLIVATLSFLGLRLWQRRHGLHLSRASRIGLAVTVLWVLSLQLWGFVWRWDSHFTGPEFIVLHLSLPLVGLTAVVLSRWVERAR